MGQFKFNPLTGKFDIDNEGAGPPGPAGPTGPAGSNGAPEQTEQRGRPVLRDRLANHRQFQDQRDRPDLKVQQDPQGRQDLQVVTRAW